MADSGDVVDNLGDRYGSSGPLFKSSTWIHRYSHGRQDSLWNTGYHSGTRGEPPPLGQRNSICLARIPTVHCTLLYTCLPFTEEQI